MVPWRRSLHAVLVLGAVVLSLPALAQSPNPGCEPWAARLVSYQGTLTSRRASGIQLASVRLNDTFCVGDVLEIGPFSRAAIQLPDQTVVRLDQGTIVTFAAPQDDKRTWLDILKGVIHVISRDPRALRVITPFANAGIEGTEFLVRVDVDTALVLVYEGSVKVANPLGEATAGSGQSVLATAVSAPVLQQVVRPRDQVVWTLYYPPLSSLPPVGAASAATPTSLADLLTRAEQRLAVGRITEAEADLAEALKLEPGSAEVLARQSVIALTRNDAVTATELVDRAVTTTPGSVSARLAQSYARQSAADLPGAVATLEAAAADHPDNALVRARLAELYLASGDVKRSEASAKAAVAADPTLGLAQSILGFAKLTRVQLEEARSAFNEAIRLEPNAPLPRLGLGLAKIRDGDLAAGREEIETAVILDPNNSLVRSYMGKAYYEEKRDELAESQLAIAKELDPNDPTPWFYDAIRKQTTNDPVGALTRLRKSTELNDGRAVYRSGLLLDDDAAARNASVSAAFNELGFESLAALQGTVAVTESFGNSSAHRLLASVYGSIPRYEISRVSEAFQAQIRQPLTAPPISLDDSIDRLGILQGIGPARVGVNEYNTLFNSDELRIRVDGAVGSRGTFSDQFVASGLVDRFSFALSQLHYETDGFSANGAAEKDVYSAFVQSELNSTTTLQAGIIHTEFDVGYDYYAFDEVSITPTETIERTDVFRLNGRYAKREGSNVVWTIGFEDRELVVNFQPLDLELGRAAIDTYVGEVQRLDSNGNFQVISGLSYVRADLLPTYDASAYAYAQWSASNLSLQLIGGFVVEKYNENYTQISYDDVDRTQVSPKIGVIWSPRDGTTLRAAGFASVRRPLIGGQTLEPTQIAGFNQFFTGIEQFYGDPVGAVSRRVGLGLDQVVSPSLFAGVEGALRQVDVPSIILESDKSWRERSFRGYLYKTLGSEGSAGGSATVNASLSLTIEYEEQTRPKDFSGPEAILDLETLRVPLGVSLFGRRGLTARLATSFVSQSGRFSLDTFEPIFRERDHAWVTDASVEYRLPARRGILSLTARNVFDSKLDLLESDPLSPRVATRRLVTGGFSLWF